MTRAMKPATTARPAARKVRGEGWWLPAVATAYGPRPLPHGARQPSRYLARKEAARLLAEGEP